MSIGGAMLGSAQGEIRIDVDQARRNVEMLQRTIGDFDQATSRIGQNVGAAGGALAGVGAILLGGLGAGVGVAADFEAQMSAVGAVTNATTAEMEALRATALRLGADTSFSASESAAAIEELGKAGVSTKDILNGAADGAVALAAAAGIAVPDAAILMSNALNVFNLAGSDAVHVADLFAAAANASAADASGLGQALAQAGTVAASFGISIEDTVGALALFADNGLKASDAGTSLKTLLTSMLDPTDKQAQAMRDLGLDFFDAQGNFIGLDGVAGELRESLAGLSQEERATALAVLFGSDAVRAANILYGAGAEGVDEYTDKVNQAGAAQDAAAKRLDNFKGSLEQLRGSLETAGILIGSIFLPFLRELVDAGTAVLNAFIDLPGAFKAVAAVGAAVVGIASALAGGFLLLLPRIVATIKGFKELRILLAGLSLPVAPILAVVAALAALGVAYKTNLFGFADAVNGVFGGIKDAASGVVAAVGPIIDVVGALAGTNMRKGHFGDATREILDFGVALRKAGLSADSAKVLTDAMFDLAKPIRRLRNTLSMGKRAFNDFTDVLSGKQLSTKQLEKFQKRLTSLFGAGAGADLFRGAFKLRDAFADFGAALRSATGVDLGKFFSLRGVVGLLVDGFTEFVDVLRDDALPVIGTIAGVAINGLATGLAFVADHMDDVVTGFRLFGNLMGGVLGNLRDIGAAILDGNIGGALAGVGQLVRDFFADGLEIAGWVLSILAPTVTAWASDLWAWVRDEGLPGFFDLVGDIPGWALSVGIPWLVGPIRDIIGRLGSWLRDQLLGRAGSAAGVVVPLGTVTLQAAIGTAGDLLRWAGRGLAWIKDQLFAGAELAVRLGSVAVDAALNAGPAILVVASRFAGWLKDRIVGAWNGIVDIGSAAVEAAVNLGNTLLGVARDFGSWLIDRLTSGWDHRADIGSVIVDAALSLDASVDFSAIGTSIKNGVVGAVTGLTTLGSDIAGVIADKIGGIQDWGSFITSDSFNFGESLGVAVRGAIGSSVEFIAGIVGGIADAIADAEITAEDVGEIGGKIIDAIALSIAAVAGAGVAIVSALAGFLKGLVFGEGDIDMSSTATAVFDAIVAAIAALPGIAADVISAIAEALATAVTSSTFTTAAGDIVGAIGDAILNTAIDFAEQGAKIGKAIVDGIIDYLSGISLNPLDYIKDEETKPDVDSGRGFARRVIPLPGRDTGLANIAEQLGLGTEQPIQVPALDTSAFLTSIRVAQTALGSFGASIAAALGRARTQIEAATASMGALLTQFAATAGARGRDIDRFRAAVAQAMTGATVAVRTAVAQITASLQSLIGPAGNAGSQAGASFSRGFATGIGGAVNTARSVVNQIRGAVSVSLFSPGYSIGQSLGAGIQSGIASTVSAVAAAAANLVSAAVSAARNAAQIRSPSRLMAREIGVPLSEGVALGITQGGDAVGRSLSALIGGLSPTLPAFATTNAALRSMPMQSATAAGGGNVVNVFALHPDDWVRYASMAERGAGAAQWVEGTSFAHQTVFGRAGGGI